MFLFFVWHNFSYNHCVVTVDQHSENILCDAAVVSILEELCVNISRRISVDTSQNGR